MDSVLSSQKQSELEARIRDLESQLTVAQRDKRFYEQYYEAAVPKLPLPVQLRLAAQSIRLFPEVWAELTRDLGIELLSPEAFLSQADGMEKGEIPIPTAEQIAEVVGRKTQPRGSVTAGILPGSSNSHPVANSKYCFAT